MHWSSALVKSTEIFKTFRFRKFISEIQFITHFPKIFPSENFLLYGNNYPLSSIVNLFPHFLISNLFLNFLISNLYITYVFNEYMVQIDISATFEAANNLTTFVLIFLNSIVSDYCIHPKNSTQACSETSAI